MSHVAHTTILSELLQQQLQDTLQSKKFISNAHIESWYTLKFSFFLHASRFSASHCNSSCKTRCIMNESCPCINWCILQMRIESCQSHPDTQRVAATAVALQLQQQLHCNCNSNCTAAATAVARRAASRMNHEWVMSHVWIESCYKRELSHVTYTQILSESLQQQLQDALQCKNDTHSKLRSCERRCLGKWVMSHIWNESCHSSEWVVSHIWHDSFESCHGQAGMWVSVYEFSLYICTYVCAYM